MDDCSAQRLGGTQKGIASQLSIAAARGIFSTYFDISWKVKMKRSGIQTKASLLLAMTYLLTCPIAVCAQGNRMNALSEKLIVESRRGQVLVKMTFKNQSERTVFVPNEIAVERDLSRALFEISDEEGNKIAYIGIMAKRAAPTADDYHPIKLHSTHRNTINITDSYAFKSGQHRYTLSYQENYLVDLLNVNQHPSLATLKAEFSHTK